MVFQQLAVLHLAVAPQQQQDERFLTKAPLPSDDPLFYWNNEEWSTKLSQECSICQDPCEPGDLVAHLHDHHGDLIQSIMSFLRPASKHFSTSSHPHLEARESIAGPGGSRHVHTVSPAGDFQHHSSYSADNSSLEARSGPENGYPVPAPQAHDHDLSRTPGQDVESGSSLHHDGDLARSHSSQPHHRGWSVELPVLEPADQTGTSHAEDAHLDDQHAEPSGRADRTDQGSDSGSQTQVPEGLRSGLPPDQNHALGATGKPPTPTTLRGPSDAVSFVGVEPPARPPQAPHSERQPHRRQFGEGIIWPIDCQVEQCPK